MNKKEAVEILEASWFVGEEKPTEVKKALELALKCFDEAKPYKAKAKALRAENKVLAMENKVVREELLRQLKALKAIIGGIVCEDFQSMPGYVVATFKLPKEVYVADVEPIELDERYHEGEGENGEK